jgi:hypothetical protein
MDNNLTNKTNKIITEHSHLLDSEVCLKLNRARQKALSSNQKKSIVFNQWFIPVTALSAMLIYLLLPLSQDFINHNSEAEKVNYAVLEDIQNMEIIEQYELIEDLEFYEWLSYEDETSSI